MQSEARIFMRDKNGKWLEVGDHIIYKNQECTVMNLVDGGIILNSIDGSCCAFTGQSSSVELIKKSSILATYYRYLGDQVVSCATLEALCKVTRSYEDSWERSINVEEVQLVVNGDGLIEEKSKIIGHARNGEIIRV